MPTTLTFISEPKIVLFSSFLALEGPAKHISFEDQNNLNDKQFFNAFLKPNFAYSMWCPDLYWRLTITWNNFLWAFLYDRFTGFPHYKWQVGFPPKNVTL